MMLFHSKCRSMLYVDISKAVKIIASVGISSSGFSVGVASITPSPISLEFSPYCPECGCNVPMEEVMSRCGWDGSFLKISDAYIISGGGGIYCETHARQAAEGRQIIRLSQIIENNRIRI